MSSVKLNLQELDFIQTRDINKFRPLFRGLEDEFGTDHYDAILEWCNILDKTVYFFWEIYLIRINKKIVGICGLYSITNNDIRELWIGWFGILEKYRGLGIGKKALEMMEEIAIVNGSSSMMVYTANTNKDAQKFYVKNGFIRNGKEWNTNKFIKSKIKKYPKVGDHFDLGTDIIFRKKLKQ